MWQKFLTFLRKINLYGSPVTDLELEVRVMIDEYRTRLRGDNRFLLNFRLLQDTFPEYSKAEIFRVWEIIKKEGLVIMDATDNEWCIK